MRLPAPFWVKPVAGKSPHTMDPIMAVTMRKLHDMIAEFNRTHRCVRAMLVNQFGWGRRFLGSACPEAMTFDDLRRATDVEFGQSVYEPFGIAHFEPLGSGAICMHDVHICFIASQVIGINFTECMGK